MTERSAGTRRGSDRAKSAVEGAVESAGQDAARDATGHDTRRRSAAADTDAPMPGDARARDARPRDARARDARAEAGRGKSRADDPPDGARALPFAMVITDPHLTDNPIIYVNKAFERITRYTADYAIGRNCRFLQGPDTSSESVEALREGTRKGEDVSVDILNYRADGEPFMNRLLVAPLYGEDGTVTSLLGIQREIPIDTDQAVTDAADDPPRGVAEELASVVDAPEGTDELAALRDRVGSHLAAIVGLVRFDEIDPEELPEAAPRALGRRIEGLQLLYEELDRGGVGTLDCEHVALGAYLSRVAATLTHLEGRRSIRVNVDCDEVDLPVTATARVGLLTTELILNALRHAFPDRRDGLVNVEFKVLTGGRARLAVKDDGVGLTGDVDWPYASESGAREAERRHERRTGARVGARLVRQMVEALDAEIDVASGAFGTTVQIGLKLDGLSD